MVECPSIFSDLRVLDRSTRLSGAFCARLFGDFGADVVLAETPEGHPLRREPPFLGNEGDEPGSERSLLHAYANANKRSVLVPHGDQETLASLVRWADVIVTNDAQHGCDELRALAPSLVQVSITPYGLDGPLAGAPGNDLTAYATSSWAVSNRDPEAPPLKGSMNQAGYLAGLDAFVGAAAAVYERDRSGIGQLVDVSELEALTVTAGPSILVAQYAGAVAPPHRADFVRGPVPCKDGYLALTISRAQFWRDAMTVLGLDDLAEDERYAPAWYRRQQRDSYSGRVEERLREWNRWDLFEALAARRCIVGPVLDTREINENEHLAARGFFVPSTVAGVPVQFPGAPFRMTRTPWALRSTAPALPTPPAPFPGKEGGAPATSVAARHPTPDALAHPSRILSLSKEPVVRRSTSSRCAHREREGRPTPDTLAHPEPVEGHPTPSLILSPSKDTRHPTPDTRSASGGTPDARPLAGVCGIVLTQAWSGTFATELLALLGAEIVQIEARVRPDSWRGDYSAAIPQAIRDPEKRQRPWNTSGLYNAVNLNKRAITLDLGRPRGIELFQRLVRHADLVAENFSPRVMDNLGLSYKQLRQLKPHIILASLSAYGATGPYANVPGIGGTLEPMSGMSSLLGYEGGRPQNSGSMYPDPVAGYYLAAALIMALRHRDRTGEGQWIDLGMMEANASFIGDALLEYSANGHIRPRLGNHHLRIAPHNIYRCRDGRWLALSADDEAAWQGLASLMGLPELCDDPRFATMAGRKANEAALDAFVAGWVLEQDAKPLAEALTATGVTAAEALDALEVLGDEQLRVRSFFVEVEHPEAGRRTQAGVPWRFSRTPAAVTRPAPMLGEHGREVLAQYAGVSDAEYDELVAEGITGDMPPE